MTLIRPAAVAGRFYPANPLQLHTLLEQLLQQAPPAASSGKVLIVPHAGYIYSGPIAASAYACLPPQATSTRVVLLGPSHHYAFKGIALPQADVFATPLGKVHLDTEAMARLRQLPWVSVSEQTHQYEHCLEVQLPFLQHLLADFRLLPLLVGTASPAQVADVLQLVYAAEDTLILISSDLSHYLDYASAQRLDQATSTKIEHLAYAELKPHEACGCVAVQGVLLLAQRLGLKATTVDLRNSGDTAGDKQRVVGYGAYVIH